MSAHFNLFKIEVWIVINDSHLQMNLFSQYGNTFNIISHTEITSASCAKFLTMQRFLLNIIK